MGKNQNENETERELDKCLKSAWGWNDEQILKGLRNAEKEVSEKELPMTGEYSFERLLKDIEERKLEPQRDRNEEKSEKIFQTADSVKEGEACFVQSFAAFIRVSVAAATAASLMLFLCISSIA